jgi:2-polyprenyl-3-methyl-5-hydroxy-6-metoxy-1,4-benzoquinol methylase
MKEAHDSWAKYYDFVYETTYGYVYNALTENTLNTIHSILSKGTIIDYGAGTGRISIPLKKQGYEVIAVEKSSEMAKVLEKKAKKENLDIKLFNCSISEYKNGKSDLAIAIFTVLSYSITEEELVNNLKNIINHLNPKGYLFLDLPLELFFANNVIMNIQEEFFSRYVEVLKTEKENIYTYKETCNGIFNGQKFSYEDEFLIRYWDFKTIDEIVKDNGLEIVNENFSQFHNTGSRYKLYQKS